MTIIQQMGHYLFPFYCFLLWVAYACNWRDQDQRLFVLFYLLGPIALFQLLLDGEAPKRGFHWYELVAFVQFCVYMTARLSEVRAAKTIMRFCLFAIPLNAAYYANFRWGLPMPKHGFFLGMVAAQLCQIGALIVFSPAVRPFLRRAKSRQPTRSEPWETRVLTRP